MMTIAYLTFRQNPRFEWFAASLARELKSTPAELQVIVIDGQHATRRLSQDFECHPPKPTVLQGPHRLTQRDYFCAANTRNTALALARYPHVAFVDDLSVLLPGWLRCHLHAAANRYVLLGTTCKYNNVVVEADGSYRHDAGVVGIDSRLKLLKDGLQSAPGDWLYGGTFSVPLEAALAVNGQDEINDTIGGEDYDFGIRLERTGIPIRISRACGTIEDDFAHHAEAPMIRLDKPWSGSDGPYSSNFLLNRLRRESNRIWTLGNDFNLRELRTRILDGGSFPIPSSPKTHWVDGQPLSEM